jgi:hypothetical protein
VRQVCALLRGQMQGGMFKRFGGHEKSSAFTAVGHFAR